MIRFARTCDAIAHVSGTLEKLAVLSAYLREVADADLAAASRFFAPRRLGLGGRSIVAAARRIWGFSETELRAAYRAAGDLGAALGTLFRPPQAPELFEERLTPATLAAIFDQIANASGTNAARTREALCERVLRAGSGALEVAYAVKLMTGDLRIGLREGFIVDAVADAFGVPSSSVRRALMACGDLGTVALAARRGTLADIRLAYGTPLGFMLASPLAYGDAYPTLAGATWLVDDKYDGIRAQAHVDGTTVRIFSRTSNDVAGSFPEVANALRNIGRNAILDGELLAQRDGRVLPFRFLQSRLQRKDLKAELLRDVPVRYVAFDLLALDEAFLVDAPLNERKRRLAELLSSSEYLAVAPYDMLSTEAGTSDVNALFEAARLRGNEGLVLKQADSAYHPGRRGRWWLKLKRELATLDVVVVAVEWGHGKRARVLSDYTFAVRGSQGLVTIGKAYSGLSDGEIAELTQWFLAHRLPEGMQRERARASEIPVVPNVALEVAFDIIQESTLHESGYALRFPRIVRIRDDKLPDDIDTLDRVRDIYREMLRREGLGPC